MSGAGDGCARVASSRWSSFRQRTGFWRGQATSHCNVGKWLFRCADNMNFIYGVSDNIIYFKVLDIIII